MTSLNDYAEQLNASDQEDRIYAAEDIGYLNDPKGVPILLARLVKEPSRAVRDVISQALIRIDSDAAIEGPIRLLESDDPQIRNQAADVLRCKGARTIPFLNAAMSNGDKDIRKLVLDILSGNPASGAGAIYAAALSDPDQNVVITAVENLGSIRAVEFRGRIEDLLQSGAHPMLISACLEALVDIGQTSSLVAIRRLFPEFEKLPDFQLASCLKAIAALGSAREFAEVASQLYVRGPHLRPAILSALIAIYQRCPSLEASDILLSELETLVDSEDSPLCRYQAVRLLSLLSPRDDVYAHLVSWLSNSERLVRLAAAEAIRMTERPGLELVLTARLREETDDEVLEALHC
jgi:HEAT repeat protein